MIYLLGLLIMVVHLEVVNTKLYAGDRHKTFFTFEEKKRIVLLHNKLRSEQGASDMQMMFWHAKLAERAQGYANKCLYGTNSDVVSAGWRRVAQLNYLTYNHITGRPRLFINKFAKQAEDYNHTTNKCAPNKICGHYTQLVWARTANIGCGVKSCKVLTDSKGNEYKHAIVVICNYAPLGNYYGVKPFKKGEACSKCLKKTPQCYKGMCRTETCDEVTCKNGGKQDPLTCFCNCTGTNYHGEHCQIYRPPPGAEDADDKTGDADDKTGDSSDKTGGANNKKGDGTDKKGGKVTNTTISTATQVLGNIFVVSTSVLFVIS